MSEGTGDGGGAWLAGLRGRRLLLAVTIALIATVLVMAARMEHAAPVDPSERIGRRVELSELIAQEQERARQLQDQVEELAARVAEHESVAVAGSDDLAELQRQVDEITAAGGLQALEGPGLVVTLEDSSRPYDGTVDPNNLVIHQQDMRAVVNALWMGGAEAVSINDARVLSTSGIYCVGNTLYLNGRHHAPPFDIRAIGDPQDLQAALERDDAVERFRTHAREYDLRFDVQRADEHVVPAHPSLVGLQVAVPAGRGES